MTIRQSRHTRCFKITAIAELITIHKVKKTRASQGRNSNLQCLKNSCFVKHSYIQAE
jgi:hypothetical protein